MGFGITVFTVDQSLKAMGDGFTTIGTSWVAGCQMPLSKTAKSRERILAAGGAKAGKSSGWLSIARLAQVTGSDAQFYVLTTDDSWERMTEAPPFDELTNIQSEPVYDWSEYESVTRKFVEKVDRGDWIVADLYDSSWEAVRRDFIKRTYGTDMASDYYAQIRKGLSGDQVAKNIPQILENTVDWNYIIGTFDTWAQQLLYRNKAHVYLATGVKPIDKREKDETIKDLFGGVGVKPSGRDATYHAQTILYFSKTGAGQREKYFVTTISDRKRERLGKTQITDELGSDFASAYLLGPAGWEAPELYEADEADERAEKIKAAKIAAAKAKARRR